MALWKRLAAGLVTGAMLLTSAGAVEATVNSKTLFAEEQGEAGLYKVNFKDENLLKNENQYVLLVASYDKASEISSSGKVSVTIDENTLTFIDQAAASNGEVSFNVRPKSYPSSLVLLGGEFNNGVTSPIVIGYIDGKGTLKTFTLKAADTPTTAKPLNLSDITFSIYSGDIPVANLETASALESKSPDEKGNLDITIPGGTLTIQLTREGYVPMIITNYSAEKSIDQFIAQFEKCAGDADNNGSITSTDLSVIISKLNTQGGGLLDVDRNGSVTSTDLSKVIPNLNIKNRVFDLQ